MNCRIWSLTPCASSPEPISSSPTAVASASIAAGNITMGDIYNVLPFDNTLVVLELSGEAILNSLEHGLRL